MTTYIVDSYDESLISIDSPEICIAESNIQDYFINPLVINSYVVEGYEQRFIEEEE